MNLSESQLITRRHFFGRTATGIGIAALGSLLDRRRLRRADAPAACPDCPHFAPEGQARHLPVQSGGPSHIDLFDYKPKLDKLARQRAARLASAWASASPA